MRVKLFPNAHDDSLFIMDILKKILLREGIDIVDSEFDVGIAIGGDGAFLHMVNVADFPEGVKFIGINNGTLGFLQEIKPTDLTRFVELLKNDKLQSEYISFEEICIKGNNEELHLNALNEVVVRDINLKTMYMDVFIDGKLLENYVGDGLMISTPIGSTAYNLSGYGAIIYNGLHTLQITPLAPINNNIYRTLINSVVIPEDNLIKLYPVHRTNGVVVIVDGINYRIESLDCIEIKISPRRLECLRMEEYNYTDIINEKFLK